MSDYSQGQGEHHRHHEKREQYDENRGYDGQQGENYSENRGYDGQQGEDGERGFFSNTGKAISGYTYKDETYTDNAGVVHNKVDKSHVVMEGLGVAAVGGLAYTAYKKFENKNETPEQKYEEAQHQEANFFKNEDGTIRKTHAALAGIAAVGAGLLGKKLYDDFEEREDKKEERREHHNYNRD
ncbi:hypothetical protein H4R26_003541 [Coemansia thaxteri]|uniref:Uncharacterized protein n=1 Tax=Coemansia thaxteri TaxID=2663907 RepID=A0A9W8EJ28_9FUNG|nr:hypothetical protein H4R26_003541 [Coemansia thaxteri]